MHTFHLFIVIHSDLLLTQSLSNSISTIGEDIINLQALTTFENKVTSMILSDARIWTLIFMHSESFLNMQSFAKDNLDDGADGIGRIFGRSVEGDKDSGGAWLRWGNDGANVKKVCFCIFLLCPFFFDDCTCSYQGLGG